MTRVTVYCRRTHCGGREVVTLVIVVCVVCFTLGAFTGLFVAGLGASASDKNAKSSLDRR